MTPRARAYLADEIDVVEGGLTDGEEGDATDATLTGLHRAGARRDGDHLCATSTYTDIRVTSNRFLFI